MSRVCIKPPLPAQRWVAYQLLLAAAQVHSRGVLHGDIKSENVLLTSWGWAFLADFAGGLKPVALPADNPVRGGLGGGPLPQSGLPCFWVVMCRTGHLTLFGHCVLFRWQLPMKGGGCTWVGWVAITTVHQGP